MAGKRATNRLHMTGQNAHGTNLMMGQVRKIGEQAIQEVAIYFLTGLFLGGGGGGEEGIHCWPMCRAAVKN